MSSQIPRETRAASAEPADSTAWRGWRQCFAENPTTTGSCRSMAPRTRSFMRRPREGAPQTEAGTLALQ